MIRNIIREALEDYITEDMIRDAVDTVLENTDVSELLVLHLEDAINSELASAIEEIVNDL